MAIRHEFLRCNGKARRFGNLDLAPSACTLASRLLPHSPLRASLETRSKQTRRFIELSAMKLIHLLLLVIPLLFLSGSFVNAGPVGNFFKKVGQSISKPLQPQPQPPPPSQSTHAQPANTPHASRRRTSRTSPATPATSPGGAQPSQPPKEEGSTGTVRRVSAADIEKAKAGLPFGI